jgi:succinylglutamic semialdehyde dehydrogenase
LSVAERAAALQRVALAVPEHAPGIAEMITAEMGKVHSEALIEAKSVAQKLQDTIALYPHELAGAAPGAPGEQRHRPVGVVAIIGPFNFPVHLINTHLAYAVRVLRNHCNKNHAELSESFCVSQCFCQ